MLQLHFLYHWRSKPKCGTSLQPLVAQLALAFDRTPHDASPDQEFNPAHTGCRSRPGCRASYSFGCSDRVQAETEGMLARLWEGINPRTNEQAWQDWKWKESRRIRGIESFLSLSIISRSSVAPNHRIHLQTVQSDALIWMGVITCRLMYTTWVNMINVYLPWPWVWTAARYNGWPKALLWFLFSLESVASSFITSKGGL